jgi:hypothetical protein
MVEWGVGLEFGEDPGGGETPNLHFPDAADVLPDEGCGVMGKLLSACRGRERNPGSGGLFQIREELFGIETMIFGNR